MQMNLLLRSLICIFDMSDKLLSAMSKTSARLPVVERDEWLRPVEEEMNRRWECYRQKIDDICRTAGSLSDYANGYRYFGWQWDGLLDGCWRLSLAGSSCFSRSVRV